MRGFYHFLAYATVGFMALLLLHFNLMITLRGEQGVNSIELFVLTLNIVAWAYPIGHLVQGISSWLWSDSPNLSFNAKETAILQATAEEFTIYDAEGKELHRPSLQEAYEILYMFVSEKFPRVAILNELSDLYKGLATVFFWQAAIFVGYAVAASRIWMVVAIVVFALLGSSFYVKWKKVHNRLKDEVFTLYILSAKQTE